MKRQGPIHAVSEVPVGVIITPTQWDSPLNQLIDRIEGFLWTTPTLLRPHIQECSHTVWIMARGGRETRKQQRSLLIRKGKESCTTCILNDAIICITNEITHYYCLNYKSYSFILVTLSLVIIISVVICLLAANL